MAFFSRGTQFPQAEEQFDSAENGDKKREAIAIAGVSTSSVLSPCGSYMIRNANLSNQIQNSWPFSSSFKHVTVVVATCR